MTELTEYQRMPLTVARPLEIEQKYVILGLCYGLVAGIAVAFTPELGPHVAEATIQGVRLLTDNPTLTGYARNFDAVRDMDSSFSKYMIGVALSLPPTTAIAASLGLAKGLYDEIMCLCGKKPRDMALVMLGADTLTGRAFRKGYYAKSYHLLRRVPEAESQYFGMRQVAIETVARHTQNYDVARLSNALDKLVEDEINLRKRAIPKHFDESAYKIEVLDDIAEHAAYPHKITFKDRFMAAGEQTISPVALLTILSAYIAYEQTNSVFKTALISVGTFLAEGFAGIFGGSSLLYKDELKKRLEHKSRLYTLLEENLGRSDTIP